MFKFVRAELTKCPPRLDEWFNGDWTGLNFAYAVIIEIRLKELKATIQVRLNITQYTVEKVLSCLLHNKVISEFITICLPKFVTFNVSNA